MAGPPSRRDDQTGSSIAFVKAIARASGAKLKIDGNDALIGAKRITIDQTSRDEVRKLLGMTRSRKRPVTVEDLRKIALALPGVTEKEVVRRDGRTVISFEVAKTMFVKLFEAATCCHRTLTTWC